MRLAFSQKARRAVERMQVPEYAPRRLAHAGTPTRGVDDAILLVLDLA